jgi:hypothetical protein
MGGYPAQKGVRGTARKHTASSVANSAALRACRPGGERCGGLSGAPGTFGWPEGVNSFTREVSFRRPSRPAC